MPRTTSPWDCSTSRDRSMEIKVPGVCTATQSRQVTQQPDKITLFAIVRPFSSGRQPCFPSDWSSVSAEYRNLSLGGSCAMVISEQARIRPHDGAPGCDIVVHLDKAAASLRATRSFTLVRNPCFQPEALLTRTLELLGLAEPRFLFYSPLREIINKVIT